MIVEYLGGAGGVRLVLWRLVHDSSLRLEP